MSAASAKTTTTAKTTTIRKPASRTAAKKTAAKTSKATGKTLVVVESPAKAKTIEKYLGSKYTVKASMGHLRDLPRSQFGIDVDHDFEPKYINIRGKGDIIKDLKKAADHADKVYLASDPDREGEAIAWHLAHILGLDPAEDCRIVFNEITKPAIQAAVKAPHPIEMERVDAQQARRLLDRIVGYQLSPLLWRKVKKGLSAGRVQSVTVKLIADREKEIEAFVSKEYWSVDLRLRRDKSPLFTAALCSVDGKRLDEKHDGDWTPVIPDEKTALKIKAELEKNADKLKVEEVKKTAVLRKAAPPFNTSSLQQDAARKLGFTSRKTMMIAQQLYEGIRIGSGHVGLITYMRTDSTRLSAVALNAVRDYIGGKFGADYLPGKPNFYSAGKNAQDAHEAIRPTDVNNAPEEIEKYLTADQFKLYRLIWQRFVACQMTPTAYDRLTVNISAGKKYLCRAVGSVRTFPGFMAVYAGIEDKREKDVRLPELQEGDRLTLHEVKPEQHFTEPPPRYNEASLVHTLEKLGIGRPSTYAPTIETIIARGYVVRVEKHFRPTELGVLVVNMLEEYFRNIVDVKFTADMEAKLDSIAEGKLHRNDLLKEFYGPFHDTIEKADEAIGHVTIEPEKTDVICELCGRNMVIRQGRYGKFLACPGFPECRNTKPIIVSTGCKCPKCGGDVLEKKSHRGKLFYGCANYPQCDFTTWDKPLKEPCPKCGSLQLQYRYKNGRAVTYCCNENCETRKDNPVNKELDRVAQRMKKLAAGAAEKAAGTAAAKSTKKTAAPKKTAVKKAKK